jgi:hypothetical protein
VLSSTTRFLDLAAKLGGLAPGLRFPRENLRSSSVFFDFCSDSIRYFISHEQVASFSVPVWFFVLPPHAYRYPFAAQSRATVIFPPLSFCSWILVPAHELDARIILPHPSFLLHFDSVSYCLSLVYSLRVLVLAQSVRTCFQRRCPDLSPAEAADFARLRGSILRCHHCHAAAGAQCSLSSIRFGLRSGILLPFWLCPLEALFTGEPL